MLVDYKVFLSNRDKLEVKYGEGKRTKYIAFYEKEKNINVAKEKVDENDNPILDRQGNIVVNWIPKKIVELYVNIRHKEDKTTEVSKKASEIKISVQGENGTETSTQHETVLYKRSYDKFLQFKNNNGKVESEKEKEIEELRKEKEEALKELEELRKLQEKTKKAKKLSNKSATKDTNKKADLNNDTSDNITKHSEK